VGKLVRTATISRGDGPVFDLPDDERDLGGFRFEHAGRSFDLATMLAESYTDGFLVLRDGAVICERYFDGMEPSDTHLLMSVSKSFNSTLCGVLVGEGALDPDDPVTDHLPELHGTGWEGASVQNLLDMRVGARWDYEVDEYTIIDVSDYRTHDRTDIPPDTETWIRTVDATHDHRGPFAYNSLATDVLGWVAAKAGGKPYAEVFSDRIWSAIGAEHDAEIMQDRKGFPVVEGGFCTTLRDLARFGLMCLQDGRLGERQILPPAWLERLRVRDQELVDAFGDHEDLTGPAPHAFYHDNWWIWDAERGIHAGIGMNGQSVFVHRPSRTVVAKLSTFPDALDADLFALHHAGILALCESLA
jgi:CubicO group peptidase (beta-lactamase class C family)